MGLLNKLLLISFVLINQNTSFAEEKFLADPTIQGLNLLSGEKFNANNEPKKLVYFWATWCPSCRQKFQNGDLAKLDQAEGVELIAVNTDKDIERAKNFVGKQKPNFSIVRDETKVLTEALGAKVAPFWAVIERDSAKKTWKLIASEEGAKLENIRHALGLKAN